MLIHFNITYPTRFGESIRIELEDGEFVETTYHEGSVWKGYYVTGDKETRFSIYLEGTRSGPVLLKRYSISVNSDVEIFLEPGETFKNVFHTKAFSVLLKKEQKEKKPVRDGKVTFMLGCDPPGPSLIPCITGSLPQLGKWKEKKVIPMKASGQEWICRFDVEDLNQDFEYKFGLYDIKKERLVEFEEGDNRKAEAFTSTALIHTTASFNGRWRGAGLNIPVSSIRTSTGWGCGDFRSLKDFIQLASRAGFRMVQLLPLNDTIATYTDKDSYPYAAISSCALHPVYLDVQQLAKAKDVRFGEGTLEKIRHLNSLPAVDYTGVVDLKLAALKVIFEKAQDDFRDDFNWFEFFNINRDWLLPYAAFCYLRDKNGTPDFSQWGVFSTYDEDMIQELASPGNEAYPEIMFYYFLQYHLHLQLQDAVDYAHERGVIIKGDLPIGVGRYSVDTWTRPGLFHLDKRAGAPPDFFTTEGQDWGFPTYNWEAMKEDGYSWWPKRLEVMERSFDALRIDHVIGLMRIWTIPGTTRSAALGYYEPSLALSAADFEVADASLDPENLTGHEDDTNVILIKDEHPGHYHFRFNMQSTDKYQSLPASQQESLQRLYNYYYGSMQQQLWRERGYEHLTLLKNSTGMLLCAEDLGFVPPVTESLLDSLQVLSLWVQRMSRDAAHNFSDISKAPYLSVVTPSTHDMPVLREWWESEHTSRTWFAEQVLQLTEDIPSEFTPAIATRIICQHLESPAMWSVFLLQDVLSCFEQYNFPGSHRINDPSNNDHVWNYRMPVDCDLLTGDKTFTSFLKKLIRNAGR